MVAGGKWTTYRHMAEETVDRAIIACNLLPTNKCCTKGLLLDGAHGWSPTLFIRLVQDFGVENQVRARPCGVCASSSFGPVFLERDICSLSSSMNCFLSATTHTQACLKWFVSFLST